MRTYLLILAMLIPAAIISAQPGPRGRGFCAEKLELSAEQRDKIADLKSKHQKTMVDLKSEHEKLQIEKRELFRTGNVERKAFLDLEERIMKSQNKIRLAADNHKMDVYALLTAEQKAKFGKAGFEMMENGKKMKGNWHGRGRGMGMHRGGDFEKGCCLR